MIETILLARSRKTGKQIVLLGSESDFSAQKDALNKFDPEFNDEYDRIGIYEIVPKKKVLKLTAKKDKAAEPKK